MESNESIPAQVPQILKNRNRMRETEYVERISVTIIKAVRERNDESQERVREQKTCGKREE